MVTEEQKEKIFNAIIKIEDSLRHINNEFEKLIKLIDFIRLATVVGIALILMYFGLRILKFI